MQSFSDLKCWENDNEVTQCRKCHVFFDAFVWKHHCRSCGRIFCDTCSYYYRYIPAQDICHDTPTDYIRTNPARCCADCSTAISSRVAAARERIRLQPISPGNNRDAPHEEAEIRTVNAVEYNARLPLKTYIIQLPVDVALRTGQTVQVALNGHINHIILPTHISPGDVLYVRANEFHDNVRPQASRDFQPAIITDVIVVDVSYYQLIDQHTAGNRSVQYVQHDVEAVPEDVYLECKHCTYRNFITAESCSICESPLLS